jgi:drug/metabolite transporter (DMT)-like permease
MLSLAAGVLYGLVELFDKFVLDNEVKDPFLSALFCKLPNFAVFIVAGLLLGQPVFDLGVIGISAVLVLLYISASYFYYSGIEKEEVSRFIPTLSLNSVFVVFLSFFLLGEKFDQVTYAGITLTIGGAFIISMEKPGKRVIHNFQSSRAVLLGIGAAFLWSVRDIAYKFLTAETSIFSVLFWVGIIGLPVTLALISKEKSEIIKGDFSGFEHLLLIGSLVSVGYLIFLEAISRGPVSLASVIIKIDAAIVFVGSAVATRIYPSDFHEEIGLHVMIQKFIALAMLAAGIIMIQLV